MLYICIYLYGLLKSLQKDFRLYMFFIWSCGHVVKKGKKEKRTQSLIRVGKDQRLREITQPKTPAQELTTRTFCRFGEIYL